MGIDDGFIALGSRSLERQVLRLHKDNDSMVRVCVCVYIYVYVCVCVCINIYSYIFSVLLLHVRICTPGGRRGPEAAAF